MRNKRKLMLIAGMIFVMGLGLTGCGKETAEEPQVQSGEDIPEDGADTEGTENRAAGEDIPEEKKDGEGAAGQTDGDKIPEEAASQTDGDKIPGEAAGQAGGDKTPEEGAAEQSEGHVEWDLTGDILEIGDGQFVVSEITVTVDEAGGEEIVMIASAPGYEKDMNKITVTYDENTVFTKQKIWDGGERHEESEATSADLEKDLMAEMNGSYEGDIFHASEIKIVEVIL